MMATFKSDLIKQQESGKFNTNTTQQRGAFSAFMQEVTIPTGMVADDLIHLFDLEPGEIIGPGSYVAYEALGTSTTIDVGTLADDDRYRAAQTTASAGQVELTINTAARTELDLAFTEPTGVYLKVEAANPTAGQKLYFFWNLFGKTRT